MTGDRNPVVETSSDDSPWTFLWGKRRSRRHAVALPIQLRRGSIHADGRVVDLSRHGALVEVTLAELLKLMDTTVSLSMPTLRGLVDQDFRLDLPSGVAPLARLVRVTWPTGGAQGKVRLGCSLVKPLPTKTLAKLGFVGDAGQPESGVATPAAAEMSRVPRPDMPMRLAVLDEKGSSVLAGPVVGIEGAAIAVHLAPVEATGVVARLCGKAHAITVTGPDLKPWQSTCHLLAVRLIKQERDAIEVVLTAEPRPSRALLLRTTAREGAKAEPRDPD